MNDGNAPIFIEMEQRSPEWFALHLGRPSTSQFYRIVSGKGKNAGARKIETSQTYKFQLLAERLFGVSFQPRLDRIAAVRHGVQHEEAAREAFAKHVGGEVRPGGVVLTRDKRLLSSPDGFVGDVPVEIKCPQPPGQLENLLTEPRDYWPQVQGQMLLTQADWCHFWSWHPHTPAVYYPVPRDVRFCDAMNYELRKFCDELDADEAALRRLGDYDVDGFLELIEASRRKETVEEEE